MKYNNNVTSGTTVIAGYKLRNESRGTEKRRPAAVPDLCGRMWPEPCTSTSRGRSSRGAPPLTSFGKLRMKQQIVFVMRHRRRRSPVRGWLKWMVIDSYHRLWGQSPQNSPQCVVNPLDKKKISDGRKSGQWRGVVEEGMGRPRMRRSVRPTAPHKRTQPLKMQTTRRRWRDNPARRESFASDADCDLDA
ncbi:hypothetical protein EVAR_102155_1 [Eumeta japonica]|uniref:Uncharacterized protein n=1 Tax=Eumeta variegata TaxID=151549 RepID=A0A4C1U197_EUMVA|nr:hypothetical protein EVAR_102155_1 [Eumeta japonica]